MKKTLKVLALCMAAILALGMMVSCSAPAAKTSAPAETSAAAPAETTAATPAETEGEAVAAIKEKGKIVMLTNAAFPPFEYLGSDNKPAGVDVDLAQEIADSLGVELEVVDMDFDGLIAALVAGKGDFVAAGMTVTDERKKSVDFADPYVTSAQYIIVKKGDTSIADAEGLKGKTVGVQKGTTGDMLASGEWDDTLIPAGHCEVEQYKSAIDAGMALVNGKLDAVIVDELPARNIVETNSEVLALVEEPLTMEDYAFAVQKGSDLAAYISDQLNAMKESGKIDELVLKHSSESSAK